jgi:biopolymer transport protein ExbD
VIFGRSKKHGSDKKAAGPIYVNVIPMIDMMIVCNVYLLMQTAVASFAKFQSNELILPKSFSKQELPYETEIAVTQFSVYIDGQLADDLSTIGETEVPELPTLGDMLTELKEKMMNSGKLPEGANENGSGFPAIIRAHEEIEFRLLQKVLYTCNVKGFDKVELAVIKDEAAAGSSTPPPAP